MVKKRLSMRKIKEVLRLKHSGLSIRAIARACSIKAERPPPPQAQRTWQLKKG